MADPANRGTNFLLSLGRLREGMTLDAARRQMGELAAQMSREHGDDRYTFTVRDVHEVVTEGASRGLWVLLGATVLLLLISCTNVANLLLARAVARERDLACGHHLARGRRQLVSQVLGETVALGTGWQRCRRGAGVGVAPHVRWHGARRTFRGSRRSRWIFACWR